jgi:hypothetical protein
MFSAIHTNMPVAIPQTLNPTPHTLKKEHLEKLPGALKLTSINTLLIMRNLLIDWMSLVLPRNLNLRPVLPVHFSKM